MKRKGKLNCYNYMRPMRRNAPTPCPAHLRVWALLTLLGTLVLAVCACSSGSEAQKKEVLDAVNRYNGMLKRAYMEANTGLMASVATEKQVLKIAPTIIALREANSFMMAEQTVFQVRKVAVKRKSATLEAEEEWHYWWQHRDTLEITKPEENIVYKIRYVLVRKDGEWLVDALEEIK